METWGRGSRVFVIKCNQINQGPLFWGNVTNADHEENFGKPTAACSDYLSR